MSGGGIGGDTAIAGRIQPPKRKQQRMTSSALQQKRVEDLKQKRHKVDAHKEAVRLYMKEQEKPVGARLLSKQVQDHAQKNMVSRQVVGQYNGIQRRG